MSSNARKNILPGNTRKHEQNFKAPAYPASQNTGIGGSYSYDNNPQNIGSGTSLPHVSVLDLHTNSTPVTSYAKKQTKYLGEAGAHRPNSDFFIGGLSGRSTPSGPPVSTKTQHIIPPIIGRNRPRPSRFVTTDTSETLQPLRDFPPATLISAWVREPATNEAKIRRKERDPTKHQEYIKIGNQWYCQKRRTLYVRNPTEDGALDTFASYAYGGYGVLNKSDQLREQHMVVKKRGKAYKNWENLTGNRIFSIGSRSLWDPKEGTHFRLNEVIRIIPTMDVERLGRVEREIELDVDKTICWLAIKDYVDKYEDGEIDILENLRDVVKRRIERNGPTPTRVGAATGPVAVNKLRSLRDELCGLDRKRSNEGNVSLAGNVQELAADTESHDKESSQEKRMPLKDLNSRKRKIPDPTDEKHPKKKVKYFEDKENVAPPSALITPRTHQAPDIKRSSQTGLD
ncbi:hypothetical protein BDV96DRAFT_644715 [Lophiotrema nucula]|uniref:Uncharacterized protein n=1 Tax=Lophiotrema nucula TaxID=690887 RepID=A0A6A5ZCV5_9PLEO|nr:hypothetical protein BDV96DRAFT_644715 [Lophiotrema nucula]